MKTLIIKQTESNDIIITSKKPWHCDTPIDALSDKNILDQERIALRGPSNPAEKKLSIYNVSIAVTFAGSHWTGEKFLNNQSTCAVIDIKNGLATMRPRYVEYSSISWPVNIVVRNKEKGYVLSKDKAPNLFEKGVFMITVPNSAIILTSLIMNK